MGLEQLVFRGRYSRDDLANFLGYSGREALTSGVICPANSNEIVLIVNRASRPDFPQYMNEFDGEILKMDGRKDHVYDQRLASPSPNDVIRLFFREGRRGLFTYYGRMKLLRYELSADKPSRFTFRAIEVLNDTGDAGGPGHKSDDSFVALPEGSKKLAKHVEYERNPKNRAAAIRKHGHGCVVCGIRFDAVYGPELAKSYIEIHHAVSISKLDGRAPNIDDLVPLCANCHRMAHRRLGEIVPIQELKDLYESRRSPRTAATGHMYPATV